MAVPGLAYTFDCGLGRIGAISFGITFSRLLEESPRWLVQKGKIEEARQLLIKIRKIDRLYSIDFEKDLDEVLRIEAEKEEDAENDKRYTFIHLCCTWKMLGQTVTFLGAKKYVFSRKQASEKEEENQKSTTAFKKIF
ncbi:hypothetical protein B9Z55_015323 [Caenorhabditis nigoni]|uniref:Major facilitator superfamily (MFS) profile domain-containing protein n=1 Tax=Caenorhabditis nigoni TaxID=1611254 RepID=A0A2G5U9Q9_9PELO|nr:hypothetical protein B9Z55_015323 [Caenorhabditis nigoni]